MKSGKKIPIQKHLETIAWQAGDVLVSRFRRAHHIRKKKNAGIVTEADLAAEAVILKYIRKHFPSSSIITEESGALRQDDSLVWVIDPLDGTTNYAHGFPWFCVSIGVYQDGVPWAGVILNPVQNELYLGERGHGATLNGKRLKVSSTRQLENALLGTGFYYSSGQILRSEMEIFRRVQEKARGVRRPGSAALDLAFVARGIYDGFWERGLSSWDVAAGMLLVQEAGGRVTTYSGEPAHPDSKECVATNGKIHSKILKLVR